MDKTDYWFDNKLKMTSVLHSDIHYTEKLLQKLETKKIGLDGEIDAIARYLGALRKEMETRHKEIAEEIKNGTK